MAEAKAQELLRREEVEQRFGVSRSWIYCEMRAGRFPEPVRISKRAVRWKVVDLDEWAAGRPVAHGEIGHRWTGPLENPTGEDDLSAGCRSSGLHLSPRASGRPRGNLCAGQHGLQESCADR